jgi:hypothetical protein
MDEDLKFILIYVLSPIGIIATIISSVYSLLKDINLAIIYTTLFMIVLWLSYLQLKMFKKGRKK